MRVDAKIDREEIASTSGGTMEKETAALSTSEPETVVVKEEYKFDETPFKIYEMINYPDDPKGDDVICLMEV